MTQSTALDVIIVSHDDGAWLADCLRSLARHAGDCPYRVTVVENGVRGVGHPAEVRAEHVRVLRVANRGFAAANNDGIHRSDAPHLLFLNPDTEIVDGTLEAAVRYLDDHPGVGLLSVRQVTADGALWSSLRRFPTAARTFAKALGSERWPFIGRRVGERVLDPEAYGRTGECDWTTGAVMFVRRDALDAAGCFDERFFLFSEEVDLALRLRRAGFTNVHSPLLTVVHHAGKAGVDPRREAQMAYARMQYARKHAGLAERVGIWVALVVHHVLRVVMLTGRSTSSSSGEASRYALKVLLRLAPPPYGTRDDRRGAEAQAV